MRSPGKRIRSVAVSGGALVALLVVLLLTGPLPGASPAGGQTGEDSTGDGDEPVDVEELYPWAAPVPFRPGERLDYEVKMGVFSVGEGSLAVSGVDSVRGHPSYRLEMRLQGGIPGARVDDHFRSWLDLEQLVSRRFHQRIREAGYESDRHYEILPEKGRWERTDEEGHFAEMPTAFPLDDVAFLYFVRTLDLSPGTEYRFHRYFKEDGNPVVVKVVGRDEITVPAGTFQTVVVRPVIQTDGLFAEGGEAELHFTDDEKHHLVYMRVKIPVVRSMTLHLRSVEEGAPRPPSDRHTGASGAASGDAPGGGPGGTPDSGPR